MITQIDGEYIRTREDINTLTFNLWYVAHSVVGDTAYSALNVKYSGIPENILTTRFKLDIVHLINGQLNDYQNNMRIHRRYKK